MSAGNGEPREVSKQEGNSTSFALWKINWPVIFRRAYKGKKSQRPTRRLPSLNCPVRGRTLIWEGLSLKDLSALGSTRVLWGSSSCVAEWGSQSREGERWHHYRDIRKGWDFIFIIIINFRFYKNY